MKNSPLFGQSIGHNILLLPVAAALMMWAVVFIGGDRAASHMTVANVWLWVALLAGFARQVLRGHDKRIRELEVELARSREISSQR